MSASNDSEKSGFRNKYLGGLGHIRSRSRSRSKPPIVTPAVATGGANGQHGSLERSKSERLKDPPAAPTASPDSRGGRLDGAAPVAISDDSATKATKVAVASDESVTAVDPTSTSSHLDNEVPQPSKAVAPKAVGDLMWDKVLKQLTSKELDVYRELNMKFPQSGDIQSVLHGIHEEAENQKNLCEARETFQIFGKVVNLRAKAEKVVQWITKVQDVGDVLASLNPHAGVPWAVVKFLLKAGTADFQERAKVIAGMDASWEMINRLQVYMEFLEHVPANTKMRENHEAAMLPLMARLVKFLIQAVKVESEGGKGIRFVTAIWSIDQVEEFEAECEGYIRHVESTAQACHRELSQRGTMELKAILNDAMRRIEDFSTFNNQLNLVQVEVEAVWKSIEDSRRGNILEWISQRDPEPSQQAYRKERAGDTGQWLLQDPVFRAWSAGVGERLFWLHGLVGAGKTFLTSHIIFEMTRKLCLSTETINATATKSALAYFFCEKDDKNLNWKSITRCFVKQLAVPTANSDAIHEEIVARYNHQQSRGNLKTGFDCEDIVNLIEKLVASRSRVVLILDGLDECDKPARKRLLDLFDELLNRISYLWIFVSSRPYGDISDQLPCPKVEVAVEGSRTEADIQMFIRTQLDNARTSPRPPPAGKLLRMDDTLCEKISKETQKKGNGMFQWVALQMYQIMRLKTTPEISAQLESFPKGLTAAYGVIFDKIRSSDGLQPTIAERAFQWLIASPRLKTSVLIEAVWQDYTHDELQDPPAEAGLDYVLDACQHLIKDDGDFCAWSHISVREYLDEHKSDWVEQAPLTVGGVVLLSMNLRPLSEYESDYTTSDSESESDYTAPDSESAASQDSDAVRYLIKYATKNWKNYLKAMDQAETGSRARTLLRRFLGGPSKWTPPPFLLFDYGLYSGPHAIWPVCYLALDSSFQEICTAGLQVVDVNDENEYGCALLEAAVEGRSHHIVEELLKMGAKPTEDTICEVRLKCDIPLLKLLLQYPYSINCISIALRLEPFRYMDSKILKFRQEVIELGREGKGPEWYSCMQLTQRILEKDVEGVRSCLQQGVNPNYVDPTDPEFETVLALAVQNDSRVVQDLLKHHADPNGTAFSRPLCLACEEYCTLYRTRSPREDLERALETVELLLDYGADPNEKQVRNTEESYALVAGIDEDAMASEDLLLLLFKHGADPNAAFHCDGKVSSVLSHAVRTERQGNVIQFLIDHGALANGQGATSGSPLGAALLIYKPHVLLLLIENGADARQCGRVWVEKLQEDIEENVAESGRRIIPLAVESLKLLQKHGGPVNDDDIKEVEGLRARVEDESRSDFIVTFDD